MIVTTPADTPVSLTPQLPDEREQDVLVSVTAPPFWLACAKVTVPVGLEPETVAVHPVEMPIPIVEEEHAILVEVVCRAKVAVAEAVAVCPSD